MFGGKKKLRRDRKAGIIFRWRGGSASNRGGFTLAFLMTTAFFAFLFFGFSLAGKSYSNPHHRRSKVYFVSEMPEKLGWWVESNSPFMESWYASPTELGHARVAQGLEDLLDNTKEQKTAWQKVEFEQEVESFPSIVSSEDILLPPASRLQPKEADTTTKARARYSVHLVTTDPSLEKRLPKQHPEYFDKISASLHRKRVDFMIGLDSNGSVVHCSPLQWVEEKAVKDLGTWLNTVSFLPGKEKLQMGIISLEIKQSKEAQK